MTRSKEHREAVAARNREILARGPMSPAENAEFDTERAWEMYQAELRRIPKPIAPELPLSLAA